MKIKIHKSAQKNIQKAPKIIQKKSGVLFKGC